MKAIGKTNLEKIMHFGKNFIMKELGETLKILHFLPKKNIYCRREKIEKCLMKKISILIKTRLSAYLRVCVCSCVLVCLSVSVRVCVCA